MSVSASLLLRQDGSCAIVPSGPSARKYCENQGKGAMMVIHPPKHVISCFSLGISVPPPSISTTPNPTFVQMLEVYPILAHHFGQGGAGQRNGHFMLNILCTGTCDSVAFLTDDGNLVIGDSGDSKTSSQFLDAFKATLIAWNKELMSAREDLECCVPRNQYRIMPRLDQGRGPVIVTKMRLLDGFCAGCFEPASTLHKCPDCSGVVFCSKECRKSGMHTWYGLKNVCYMRTENDVDPYTVLCRTKDCNRALRGVDL